MLEKFLSTILGKNKSCEAEAVKTKQETIFKSEDTVFTEVDKKETEPNHVEQEASAATFEKVAIEGLVDCIEIEGIEAYATIQVGDVFDLQIDNPEIKVTQKGDLLHISGPKKEIHSNGISINGNNVIISGGDIVMNHGKGVTIINNASGTTIVNGQCISTSLEKAKIKITVPFNQLKRLIVAATGLTICEGVSDQLFTRISGVSKVELRDIANTSITLSGSSDAKLSNCRTVDAKISGSSDFSIDNVQDLKVTISGSSDGFINSEHISNLEVILSGSSDLKIKSEIIENLSASASGASDMRIWGKVCNKYVHESGAATITFR